jgi:multidrug resistance efflux pump
VRENQSVKEGDILLELDAVRAMSARDTVLHEYIAAAAKLARLTAEQLSARPRRFPDDISLMPPTGSAGPAARPGSPVPCPAGAHSSGELAILQENLTASRIQAAGARNQLYARRQQANRCARNSKARGRWLRRVTRRATGCSNRNASLRN